ncbi:MAG: ORF6N domain-containing protein [Patescibacteria group bacterium]|nr:ORF6N domain-containing protein [Patescibacteria group bacterium]
MAKIEELNIISQDIIESKILLIRGKKVILDRDLANLYGVETRILNQAVKRNIERFPDDFMFKLTKMEVDNWISQIVISNKEKMGLRKLPYAFTEQGIAMLSSVLKSKKAIKVNIAIMRIFVNIRKFVSTYDGLAIRDCRRTPLRHKSPNFSKFFLKNFGLPQGHFLRGVYCHISKNFLEKISKKFENFCSKRCSATVPMKIAEIEQKYDRKIVSIFKILDILMKEDKNKKVKEIGFKC